jgi:hypothetical protein
MTFCRDYVHSRHIYHGQPYTRVDLNPMPESTLFPCQGLWIMPLEQDTQRRAYAAVLNIDIRWEGIRSSTCLPNTHRLAEGRGLCRGRAYERGVGGGR